METQNDPSLQYKFYLIVFQGTPKKQYAYFFKYITHIVWDRFCHFSATCAIESSETLSSRGRQPCLFTVKPSCTRGTVLLSKEVLIGTESSNGTWVGLAWYCCLRTIVSCGTSCGVHHRVPFKRSSLIKFISQRKYIKASILLLKRTKAIWEC